MVSRKINTDAIDENLLIASIGKSKIGTTTASILDGASQNPVKDTEEKEEGEKKNPRSQMDYSYTTITAPFDGYIDRIPYKTGSLVNPQSLLTTVSDISEIFAYYKVNESEYLEYKRQQLSGQKQHEENNVELILPDGSIYSHKGTLGNSR